MRVVKSISETSECVPVSFDINVDYSAGIRCIAFHELNTRTFPTDGKPTKPTLAMPVLATSKPSPPPPPPPPVGEISSRRNLASLAFSWPK